MLIAITLAVSAVIWPAIVVVAASAARITFAAQPPREIREGWRL